MFTSSCASPQDFEFAYQGEFFRASVGGVDDAEDGEHEEDHAHQPQEADHEVEAPRNGEHEGAQHGVGHAVDDGGDAQREALVGVVAGELRFFGAEQGDEDEDAEVGQDGHRLVLLDVAGVEGGGGIGRGEGGGEFAVRRALGLMSLAALPALGLICVLLTLPVFGGCGGAGRGAARGAEFAALGDLSSALVAIAHGVILYFLFFVRILFLPIIKFRGLHSVRIATT